MHYFIFYSVIYHFSDCQSYLCIIQGMDQFEDIGPCVIMASPGMMQSGLSRELFEMWCTDPNNGVIIAGEQ